MGTLPTDNPIVLFNARPDRVDRTRQFANDFLDKIPNATLFVIGENTRDYRAFNNGKLKNVIEYRNFERRCGYYSKSA